MEEIRAGDAFIFANTIPVKEEIDYVSEEEKSRLQVLQIADMWLVNVENSFDGEYHQSLKGFSNYTDVLRYLALLGYEVEDPLD